MKNLPAVLMLAVLPALATEPAPPVAARSDHGSLVTPRDFGGAGDGRTDDFAAVQKALKTGRVVGLSGGRYRITQGLEVPARGGLAGPGTLLQDFDNAEMPGKPGSHLAALRITGDGATLEGFRIEKKFIDGSYACGVLAEHVRGVGIRNLDISGYSARYGIHLVECADFEIAGCHIHDFMMNAAADMIEDSPAGLRVTRSTNGIVTGNRILRIEVGPAGRDSLSPLRPNYGKQGYQSDCVTIQQGRRITLSGNVCTTSGEGIDMLLSEGCTLANNIVADIFFQGFKMLGVSYCTVTGNHLVDCYQGIGLAAHPGVKASAAGNSIQGNVIQNTGSPGSFGLPGAQRVRYSGTHGIDLHDDGCRDNVVVGNTIVDTQPVRTTDTGVRDHGTNNVVANNLFTAKRTDAN